MIAKVLEDFSHLLPESGRALDLACGSGENACFLANLGLATSAWDWSDQALKAADELARQQQVDLELEKRDVEKAPPAPASFDVILVSHFLHRPTLPDLVRALRPGGLLFYQTFTLARVGVSGPKNPDYLLQPNELITQFSSLRILAYREEGLTGNLASGYRDRAYLVGEAYAK